MPAALRRIALVLALVAAAGCGWLKPQATPILPAEELYQLGENQLNEKRYEDARKSFTKIVERHPNSSYAPRARFLPSLVDGSRIGAVGLGGSLQLADDGSLSGERTAGPVVPERFAVLQALLAYLLAACGEANDAVIPAREIVERFHIPEEELEEHLQWCQLKFC